MSLTSYNISYFTDVILNPKLYLNLWVCDWNIFIPWNCSAIFRCFRKFLEIVWKHSWGLQTIFGESLEIFRSGRKSLENHQKTLLSVHICLYNKQNNALLLIDMNYLFLCSSLYLSLVLQLTVRHWVKHLYFPLFLSFRIAEVGWELWVSFRYLHLLCSSSFINSYITLKSSPTWKKLQTHK